MVNYSQTKIYKIYSTYNPDEFVVGATTKKYLSGRFGQLKDEYNKWIDGKNPHCELYDIFFKYGMDTCKIVLLETVDGNSIEEIKARTVRWSLKEHLKSIK